MSTIKFDQIFEEEGVAYTTSNDMRLVELARKGISKKSLLKLADIGGISMKTLSEILPVSERTIQRYQPYEK